MNEIDFTDKMVLVTGGSSGIGNGIARVFREHGATVHVTGTRESAEDYSDTDGSLLDGLTYHQLDVSDDAAVEAFDPGFERLDVLTNSVGTVQYKRREFEMAGFREVVDVNLIGVFHCCTRFHEMLARTKGTAINVGSVASYRATRGNPAYSASKGGLRTLTMSLAELWARDGVRVNGIAPGFVESKLTKISRDNPEIYEASLKSIPMRRWGDPEEMGSVVLFLASPLASYITGQMIIVDGGQSLS